MSTTTTTAHNITGFREYDDDTKLLKLLEQDGAGFIIDISICSILVIGFGLCVWKRPRTLCVVFLCWVAWLIYEIVDINYRQLPVGHVWKEIMSNEQQVQMNTKSVVISAWKFVISWIVFVVPLFLVIAGAIGKSWERTPHEYRPFFVLAGVGLIGAFLLVRSIVINRRSLAKATVSIVFHLSFIVVGPLVYWLTTKMSLNVAPWVLFTFMTVFPTLWSVFVLNSFRAEIKVRDRLDRSDLHDVTVLLQSRNPPGPEDRRIIGILKTIFKLLSYWSCWPFFHVADQVMAKKELVKNETTRSTAYGVILALVFWFQYWEASRIAPIAFRYTSKCFKATKRMVCKRKEKTRETEEDDGDDDVVEMQPQKSTKEKIIEAARSLPLANRWADTIEKHYYKLIALLVCIAALLITMSFFLSTFGIVASLASYAFLFVVGFDSSSRVVWHDTQTAPSRIGFWITIMVWLCACKLPAADYILPKFTLIVFIFAFLAGQTAARITTGCVRLCCGTCCDAISDFLWSKDVVDDSEAHSKDDAAGVELRDVRRESGPSQFDDKSKRPLAADKNSSESW